MSGSSASALNIGMAGSDVDTQKNIITLDLAGNGFTFPFEWHDDADHPIDLSAYVVRLEVENAPELDLIGVPNPDVPTGVLFRFTRAYAAQIVNTPAFSIVAEYPNGDVDPLWEGTIKITGFHNG